MMQSLRYYKHGRAVSFEIYDFLVIYSFDKFLRFCSAFHNEKCFLDDRRGVPLTVIADTAIFQAVETESRNYLDVNRNRKYPW